METVNPTPEAELSFMYPKLKKSSQVLAKENPGDSFITCNLIVVIDS